MEIAASTCHYRVVTGTSSSIAMPSSRPVELRQVAPDTQPVALGDDIKQARERAQLTQPQLAELVGVSEGTISNWERGKIKTPKNRLGRLWQVLDEYRPPAEPSTPDGEFDAAAIVDDLSDDEIQLLLAQLPDTAIIGDIARRFARTAGTPRRIGNRRWPIDEGNVGQPGGEQHG